MEILEALLEQADRVVSREELQRQLWDREEIECDDHLTVVLKEGQPVLPRIPTPADASEITRNRPLAQNKSQFQQFAVDFGRSPAGILLCQATNERAEFGIGSRSAGAVRSPAPIQTEGRPMPAYDCVRLHNDEHLFPTGPEATQSNPEQAVVNLQDWPRALPIEDGDLLTKGQDFERQISARTHQGTQCSEE